MQHNIEKLSALNGSAHEYYYCAENRNYVHSTTFVVMVHKILNPTEIIVSLRKPVVSGFYFDDTPDEDDIGYIEADNSIFYIKANNEKVIHKDLNELSNEQIVLFSLQNFLTSGYNVLVNRKTKLWSRKLTVVCPILFSDEKLSMSLETTNKSKFTLLDILFDGRVGWRQYVYPGSE